MKKLAMIVAMTDDGVIGKGGKMPWPRIAEDMAHFKKTTMGHPVIMGRKTWESIGSKLLPGRVNIVISRSTSNSIGHIPGEGQANFACSHWHALTTAYEFHEEPFVIGGGEIYKLFAPLATRLVITRIKGTYDGDVRFPPIELVGWSIARQEWLSKDCEITEWTLRP